MRQKIDADYIHKLNKDFHDQEEAFNYDARMGATYDNKSQQRTIKELESVLGHTLPKGGVVVDVASGTGNLAVKLAATNWYQQVIGVDISERSLEVAHKNAHLMNTQIKTIVSDMTILPFDDNSVDLVVGCAFLHHLPEPKKFMKELLRILKPGGEFVFIGEPTTHGGQLIDIIKKPLVLINNTRRYFSKQHQRQMRWDHANIDVHDFNQQDAEQLLCGFNTPKIITEGFLSPIIDQGLMTPIRSVLSETSMIKPLFLYINRGLYWCDITIFNYVIPKFWRVSLKLSGEKPL
ncbi:class I SAM-dependent methyltransferase [Photobacterium kishitanii]|uniref:Class I SAM-dependent methyltransferase n=1 Tax=Photobacterium kishitanii TaxID=318456 RepID=A0AAX0YYP9_9GAMM|nr:class I SAM-dependent methyltransferase [Photobacterium kishitanii]PSU20768.1 class I SAM-dependent methyltransferase [Photobacterium kishitanii]PSV07721.1 class I SAM-dependent methyltransferase [Photobacterium kishitanii]PSV15872.1 class I SAM-dependent methyltransferase [Photobacterium kishitanii]PSV76209.1 class I SAM-dependent methyltransferase [Photobacterium kishitanii]PSW62903.1 class I SAM-dependent methyltransferase [Photobacterium kishitanii]